LRLADRRLRKVAADDVHEMCAVVRRAAAAIADVETFYVGLYQGDNTLIMPYIFSGGEDLGPDTSRFGKGGMSRWIRASAKPYRYADDDGRLFHGGVPLGDGTPSRDVVVVPMFDADGRTVIGLVNAQSLESDAFDSVFVSVMEWLSLALALSLSNGALSTSRSLLYRHFPELDSGRLDSPVDLLHAATDRLDALAQAVGALRSRAATLDTSQLEKELDGLWDQCRAAGADLAMMAVRTPPSPQQAGLETLTPREREVAELIVEDSPSNAAIAQRLYISEKTVKVHVSSILRKLGLQQRAELVWLMGPNTGEGPRS
jgi:DNA-binding CsgD family transcriptional regulator